MTQTINHQVSVSQLLPGVSVSLNARAYASFDVVVFSAPGDEPSELYSGLRAVGFNYPVDALIVEPGFTDEHFAHAFHQHLRGNAARQKSTNSATEILDRRILIVFWR